MTTKELKLLEEIKTYTSKEEMNFSEFLSTDVLSKSNAGVVSSLEKKGLIFNAYEGFTKSDFIDLNGEGTKPFKMWCVTPKGWSI